MSLARATSCSFCRVNGLLLPLGLGQPALEHHRIVRAAGNA